MSVQETLKEIYTPVQPTIRGAQEDVSYQEWSPHPELQDFIYCYWQLKTNQRLIAPFNYRVVADGCIDIFFNVQSLDESFVMGFCKKYTEFPLDQEFNYAGIRFYPSAFPELFSINAKSLSDQYVWLNQLVPEFSEMLKSGIKSEMKLKQMSGILDEMLLDFKLRRSFDFDPRFYNALNLILENYGTLETETDLDVGLSQRQLRRVFNYYIGTTPKTFSKVVRFQRILNAKPSVQSLKRSKIFYDVGFFDQAHFIKDFKTFYGVTPTRAFR